MGNVIEIEFCAPDAPDRRVSLFYRVRGIGVAQRHFAAIGECVRRGLPIDQNDRFHNFPGCTKDRPWVAAELNRCIDVVNAYVPGTIDERAEPDMDQGRMNRLHVHFERLRGGYDEPGTFYADASPPVRLALEQYNLLIHRYEDRMRHEQRMAAGQAPAAHCVVNFAASRPRYPLRRTDFLRFSRRVTFGSLAIDYCDRGKPLLDVVNDRDDDIGASNIRPLHWMSADVVAFFMPSTPSVPWLRARVRNVKWWLSEPGRRARSLGYWPLDPRNALGHITVAHLDRDRGAVQGLSDAEIVALIGRHQQATAMRALSD